MPNAFRVHAENSVKWEKAKALEEMRLEIIPERLIQLGEAKRRKRKYNTGQRVKNENQSRRTCIQRAEKFQQDKEPFQGN